MPNRVFEDQVITETVLVKDLYTGLGIATVQSSFELTEGDWLRLRDNKNALGSWSLNILFASIGYGMSIAPKWISQISGEAEKVSRQEWTVLIAGLLLSAVLMGIGAIIPNERKALMKRIAEHFKTSPKQRQIMRDVK